MRSKPSVFVPAVRTLVTRWPEGQLAEHETCRHQQTEVSKLAGFNKWTGELTQSFNDNNSLMFQLTGMSCYVKNNIEILGKKISHTKHGATYHLLDRLVQ